eukprot:TRINITY_DN113_c2_g3_i3.p1 TRINITY_DN113_c2_g3~~TRINITY_DN113_c2_g3_i3.p1  ORF type:complete len:593 (-),score=246.96 TRINITY_DN113_c2_g3_i3:76-1800(-)
MWDSFAREAIQRIHAQRELYFSSPSTRASLPSSSASSLSSFASTSSSSSAERKRSVENERERKQDRAIDPEDDKWTPDRDFDTYYENSLSQMNSLSECIQEKLLLRWKMRSSECSTCKCMLMYDPFSDKEYCVRCHKYVSSPSSSSFSSSSSSSSSSASSSSSSSSASSSDSASTAATSATKSELTDDDILSAALTSSSSAISSTSSSSSTSPSSTSASSSESTTSSVSSSSSTSTSASTTSTATTTSATTTTTVTATTSASTSPSTSTTATSSSSASSSSSVDTVSLLQDYVSLPSLSSSSSSSSSSIALSETSAVFLISVNQVGILVGKAGSRIQSTRAQSGAIIRISQDAMEDSDEKSVTVRGRREQVYLALMILCHQLSDDPDKERSAPKRPYVPKGTMSSKDMFSAFQQQQQASTLASVVSTLQMQYPQLSPADISYLLSTNPSGFGLPAAPLASPFMSPQLSQLQAPQMQQQRQQQQQQQQRADTVSTSFPIPDNLAGGLIGKGGKTISEIRNSSKANIKIAAANTQPNSTDRTRMVTVSGPTQEVVDSALTMIYSRLATQQAPSTST